jgi:hypothetical protein
VNDSVIRTADLSNVVDERFQRGISKEFEDQLTGGILSPLLVRVQHDDTLSLEFRNGYVSIYYRGGRLVRLTANGSAAQFSATFDWRYCNIDPAYCPTLPEERPPERIRTAEDANRWLEAFPSLKQVMDVHFSAHPKIEREYQQAVVRDNNRHASGERTDYVILDVEYTQSSRACPGQNTNYRFDMVGLRWPAADSTSRKGLATPVIMEMKAGDGALTAAAGLAKHAQDIEAFLTPVAEETFSRPYELLRRELRAVFELKQRLQLPSLPKRMQKVQLELTDRPEVVLVFANHQPASSVLARELRALPKSKLADFRVATASHVGYGLFAKNVVPLDEFVRGLEQEETPESVPEGA